MANFFKGFKQVTLEQYNSVVEAERPNYMWLVREKSADSDVVKSSAIYFGNRKYAEINNSNEELVNKLNSIVSVLGMTVGEEGTFNKYLPIAEDAILSGETITNVSEALKALSKAIVAAEATANGANKVAGEAKTTAEGAVSTANTAKETADAASTTATSAKDAADAAKAATDTLNTTVDGISGKVTDLKTNSATKAELQDEVKKLAASIDGKTLTAGNDIKINDKNKSINVSLAEDIP